jgi:hypothetical protein
MPAFDSLVSNADHVTHPAIKPLADKLSEFHRQFFVVDSHLRRFGQGYLHVADRWFEYFTSALGPEDLDTPEETAAAIALLDGEIAKLGLMLSASRTLATLLVPTLPNEYQESMRTKLLVYSIEHAERLHSFVAERRAAIAQKYHRELRVVSG